MSATTTNSEGAPVALIPARMLKAASNATAREPGRLALHGVHLVDATTVEASDGRVLVRISHEPEEKSAPLKGCIVRPDDLAPILKAEKGSRRMPGLVAVDVAGSNANGTVKARGASSGVSMDIPKIDGVFPPVDAIIPPKRADDASVVYIRLDYLIKIVKAGMDAGVESVRVQLPADPAGGMGSAKSAIRFDSTSNDVSGDPLTFLAVQAPCSGHAMAPGPK